MSRTNKDAPYWTKAEWWEPRHGRCTHGWSRPRRDCDLPATPVRRAGGRPRWPGGSCYWWPVYVHHCQTPPRWYVNYVWTAVERQAARIECRNAVKEHRATGEVDTIPTTRQARHCARRSWC